MQYLRISCKGVKELLGGFFYLCAVVTGKTENIASPSKRILWVFACSTHSLWMKAGSMQGSYDLQKQNWRSWHLPEGQTPALPYALECLAQAGDINDKWMWLVIIFPSRDLMLEEQKCWKRKWRWTGTVPWRGSDGRLASPWRGVL